MKCKRCGTEFSEGKYCPECGEQVCEDKVVEIKSQPNVNKSGTNKIKEILKNIIIGFAITIGIAFLSDELILVVSGIICAVAAMILVSKIFSSGGVKIALSFIAAVFAFSVGKNAVLQIVIHPDANFKQLVIFYVAPITLGCTIIISKIRNL